MMIKKVASNLPLYFLYAFTAFIFFDSFYTYLYMPFIYEHNFLDSLKMTYYLNPTSFIFHIGFMLIILYKGRI